MVFSIRQFHITVFDLYLGDRFLPALPLLLMMIPEFINQYISAWGTYLRCHKQEPYLINSVVTGILCCLSTVGLGHLFGVMGITTGYASSPWPLPGAYHIYTTKKRQWHNPSLAIHDTLLSISCHHNRAACIESQLTQLAEIDPSLFKQIEVIVSDNCSTDATPQVVERFKGRMPFVLPAQEEKLALTPTSCSVCNSQSKYVWLLGDDDLLQTQYCDLLDLLEEQRPASSTSARARRET